MEALTQDEEDAHTAGTLGPGGKTQSEFVPRLRKERQNRAIQAQIERETLQYQLVLDRERTKGS